MYDNALNLTVWTEGYRPTRSPMHCREHGPVCGGLGFGILILRRLVHIQLVRVGLHGRQQVRVCMYEGVYRDGCFA